MLSLSKIVTSTPHIFCMPCLRSFATTSNTLSSTPFITPRHWKNRGRGGQNRTERYRRLENTLRGQNASIKQISELSQEVDDASKTRSLPLIPPSRSGAQRVSDTIAGFTIPEEPMPPADEECCMSGCAICVYDLYEESLEAYKESLAVLRSSLSALSIAEFEWPERIRTTTKIPTVDNRQGAILSAFEEMERQLKEKRERRAAVEAEKRARGELLSGDREASPINIQMLYEGIRWVLFPKR